jgi:periplasmic copper chaperone A
MKRIMLIPLVLLWGCAPDAEPPAPADAPEAQQRPQDISDADSEGPAIRSAWVRSVPPTAMMTAGYLSVFNPGPDEIVIVAVESPQFGSIEMHGTDIVDGVSRMRQRETVAVPPGETVSFEPGGLHLMLMEPVDGIPESGSIELVLVLEDGSRLETAAAIGRSGG